MIRGRRRRPFALKLKRATLYSFSTVILFIIAGLIILSFSRQGHFLAKFHYLLAHYFGWGILFLPFIFIAGGLMLTRLSWRISRPNVFVGSLLFLVSTLALTQAGLVGFEIWQNLAALITGVGAFLVFLGSTLVGLAIAFNTSLEEIILSFVQIISKIKTTIGLVKKIFFRSSADFQADFRLRQKEEGVSTSQSAKLEPEFKDKMAVNLANKGQIWEYPPFALLSDNVSTQADRGDIKKNAEVIERTLESFGISARVAEVNLGPAVTQYALEIALGTKLSKITALSTDLALALAAPTGQIRIEAPIPGRSMVGVEVPNHTLQFVTLKQMLTSPQLKKTKSKLVFGLGLNVAGEAVIADIGRMPHILIAGSTGSGKSVCIHSIIATILFRTTPAEVRFILVDPKRVELTRYNNLPHLLTPVIVEPEKVLSALKWAIAEMDRRYKLFAEVGARNIDTYNEMSGFAALPYILIVIDELADIILFSPADVEDAICRIAQMARATGIHLIVSTQRPSVDVITGLIKANIPCRIAFNVSSQVDSRVIIDMPGAEKLLGRGDMLFIPPDQAKPTRIQGAFVSEPEIQKLIEFFQKSGYSSSYTEEVTQQTIASKVRDFGEIEEKDELFEDAVQTICRYERASASLLQRRLRIGYARAARILDQLERAGLVGPAEGAKPRDVLVKNAQEYLSKEEVE